MSCFITAAFARENVNQLIKDEEDEYKKVINNDLALIDDLIRKAISNKRYGIVLYGKKCPALKNKMKKGVIIQNLIDLGYVVRDSSSMILNSIIEIEW